MHQDDDPDDETPEVGHDRALGEFGDVPTEHDSEDDSDEFSSEIDGDFDDDRNDPIQQSGTIGKFRRTGAGMVLNGIALGLAEIFDGSLREDPPIVQEAQGEPDTPRHVEAYLDPDDPAASSVIVRSWRAVETADTDTDADS